MLGLCFVCLFHAEKYPLFTQQRHGLKINLMAKLPDYQIWIMRFTCVGFSYGDVFRHHTYITKADCQVPWQQGHEIHLAVMVSGCISVCYESGPAESTVYGPSFKKGILGWTCKWHNSCLADKHSSASIGREVLCDEVVVIITRLCQVVISQLTSHSSYRHTANENGLYAMKEDMVLIRR